VASEEIIPLPCKCSILLGLTFVEIKNYFTKTLLVINFLLHHVFFTQKKTQEDKAFTAERNYYLRPIFQRSLFCPNDGHMAQTDESQSNLYSSKRLEII